MAISERAKRGVIALQKAGILKEPYQSMTEKELFAVLEDRIAELKKETGGAGTNSAGPIDENIIQKP